MTATIMILHHALNVQYILTVVSQLRNSISITESKKASRIPAFLELCNTHTRRTRFSGHQATTNIEKTSMKSLW